MNATIEDYPKMKLEMPEDPLGHPNDSRETSDSLLIDNSAVYNQHPHVKQENLTSATLVKAESPFTVTAEEFTLIKSEPLAKIPHIEMVTVKEERDELKSFIKENDEITPESSYGNVIGYTKSNNFYLCDACLYQSKDIMKLKTHLVLHQKDKPFRCLECKFTCSTKFDLTLHIVKKHNETFGCTQCKYTSTVQEDMEQHTVTHSVEVEEHMKILAAAKPFKCRYCEYRAAKEYFVEKHMIKHSKENCFKCKICDFSTELKCKLQEHEKAHRKRKRAK